MNSKHILISIVAPVAALCAMGFGMVAVVTHNGTVREVACVEAGGSYVLTEAGTGRECRK